MKLLHKLLWAFFLAVCWTNASHIPTSPPGPLSASSSLSSIGSSTSESSIAKRKNEVITSILKNEDNYDQMLDILNAEKGTKDHDAFKKVLGASRLYIPAHFNDEAHFSGFKGEKVGSKLEIQLSGFSEYAELFEIYGNVIRYLKVDFANGEQESKVNHMLEHIKECYKDLIDLSLILAEPKKNKIVHWEESDVKELKNVKSLTLGGNIGSIHEVLPFHKNRKLYQIFPSLTELRFQGITSLVDKQFLDNVKNLETLEIEIGNNRFQTLELPDIVKRNTRLSDVKVTGQIDRKSFQAIQQLQNLDHLDVGPMMPSFFKDVESLKFDQLHDLTIRINQEKMESFELMYKFITKQPVMDQVFILDFKLSTALRISFVEIVKNIKNAQVISLVLAENYDEGKLLEFLNTYQTTTGHNMSKIEIGYKSKTEENKKKEDADNLEKKMKAQGLDKKWVFKHKESEPIFTLSFGLESSKKLKISHLK